MYRLCGKTDADQEKGVTDGRTDGTKQGRRSLMKKYVGYWDILSQRNDTVSSKIYPACSQFMEFLLFQIEEPESEKEDEEMKVM